MEGQVVAQQLLNQDQSIFIVFLKNNWLNIIFGLITTISFIIGYLSWRYAEKQKEVFGYLFNLAEKNIDKDITEANLSKRKEEVEKMSNQIAHLQQKIRDDIPKEARKAVLKDRLFSQIAIMKQHYDSIINIKKELQLLSESPEIPPELMKSIENEISPEYILKERRSNLKTYLTIIASIAALLSTIMPIILPYEIVKLLNIIIFLPFVPILYLFIKTYNIYDKIYNKRLKYQIGIYMFLVLGSGSTVLMILMILLSFVEKIKGAFIVAGVFFIISLFFFCISFYLSKKIKTI